MHVQAFSQLSIKLEDTPFGIMRKNQVVDGVKRAAPLLLRAFHGCIPATQPHVSEQQQAQETRSQAEKGNFRQVPRRNCRYDGLIRHLPLMSSGYQAAKCRPLPMGISR